jgi:ADP-ribose pyrophosphatase YjhB (NUDIX family)
MGVRCVVLNGGDEVLLVKHTYIEGWHLPGGGIGVGESAQEAVIREVHEETGYMLAQRPELICISQCKDTSKRDHVALFLIEGFFKKKQEFSSFEISDAKFYSIDNLPSDTDEMTKIWLADALSKSQRVKEALKII